MTNWDSLDRALHGRVLRPGAPGFDKASQPVNRRRGTVSPAAVASVVGARDVSRAVIWARDNGVPLVARGGGHSYAGYSVGPGLVLDLSGLSEVRVDPDTGLVTVGGGTTMGRIYDALRANEITLPLGNSDQVGIGGLVLGGGVAATSRAFGLTCDSLVRTEVVLADGRVVSCDRERDADLFWACRGGGGGNFGVNVSFMFQARPARAGSTCLLLWHRAHAAEVLAALQEIMWTAPDEFSARIGVSVAAPGQDAVVSVVGLHLGPAEELRELLAPALASAEPYHVDIADRTYWEAKEYLHHTTSGDPFAVRTRCAVKPLSDAGAATLLAALDTWPGGGNPDGAGFALFTWGGAIGRVPATATAFPHRDALFLLSMDTSWSPDDPASLVRDNLAWLTALHEKMGEFASGGAYVNFTDPDLPDWRSAYYGPNLPRLTDVKRRYDPDRFFQFPQAI